MLNRLVCCLEKSLPYLLTVILVATANVTKAQDLAFDQVYDRIWKESAHSSLDSAVASADSLYRSTSTATNRMRCLMLIARLYQQKEQLDKSVEYALKIELLANEASDYAWQVRANGYLAGLYRMMELYGKAKSYSSKALEIVPKIPDRAQANNTRGMLLQELGFTSMDQENYEQAIQYFQQAGAAIQLFEKNKEFNLMNNERLLADNYRLLARYDSALIHYHKALKLTSSAPSHYATGLVYKGLAETFMEKGSLPEAKQYLDKAERFADKSEYLQLKEATYELSKRYYSLVKDQQRLAAAREKSNAITDTILDKRAQLLDTLYTQYNQDRKSAEDTDNMKNSAILGAIILIVFGSIFGFTHQRKQKRELAQVRNVLAQFDTKQGEKQEYLDRPVATASEPNRETVVDISTDKDVISNFDENTEKRMMPIETEEYLLAMLVEFEKSDAFLQSGFSLASLAAQIDTNTKYLSYLVKNYKQTDFNNYINGLRINYVIDMLRNDPAWRKHKISTIAASSGFSSHSQFAAVFKDFTGVTPSVFIKHIDSQSMQR